MVGNQAYFEALAEIESEESDEYRSIFAGLLVMRLVTDWFRMGPHAITTDITGLEKVKAAVAQISENHALRSILEQLIEAISRGEDDTIATIGPRLLSYGTLLAYDARWGLAIDVFQQVLDETRFNKEHSELALTAARHMGSAYRHKGDYAKAAEYYSLLKTIAVRAKNASKRLIADIGFANLAANRGDLPAAEVQLRAVLEVAEDFGLQDVCATVLLDLSYVVARRGRTEDAICYGHRALELTTDVRNRDRVLHNLANWFLDLGHWQVAQKASLILAATAQEKHVRAWALIDLLRIAALTGQIEDFNRYCAELETMTLHPLAEVGFYRYLGEGYARLGRISDAQKALHKSIAVSEANQLNQALFEAEQLLAELQNLQPAQTQTSLPTKIEYVANAITALYDFARAKV